MTDSAELLKSLKIDRTAPPPPRKRWPWLAAAAVLMAVIAVGGFFLRGQGGIEVRTAPAVAMSSGSAAVLDATGYVVARRMATVSSKITGKVREVMIEEGQQVEAGDIMATLDPIDANAERNLARAQLAAARSQIDAAQAQSREAAANAARLQPLARQQLVSSAQYDQAVAERDALRSQLQTAQRNAQVAADRLAIADNGVDNTVVRAPFTGVVIAKAAQPGEIISPLSAGGGFTRTGIGTIVDMDSLEVEVDVGEAYIGRVTPKMPVEAVLNAYPDWRIPGSVIAIIPTADRGKATVKVRVALDEKDPRIVPDMGVRVSFMEQAKTGEEAPAGVRVPAAAVVTRDGKDIAFVLGSDDTVAQRAVEAGIATGSDRQVLSGLKAGETVVLDPPTELKDGAKVRLAKDASP
ncbi:efflux RND transporter periplasmic adaptor subunit [Novilysobacter antarcticus]|uniref:efflux RND transporter periplasmic adaptor subunit n=1 Tax=Novilysobacter antarcticus TaxID=2862543 RepID=UPI001C991BB0|nr:efflux RND transporter periplasmic adaptor subunit [Lysobacter antarcticus]